MNESQSYPQILDWAFFRLYPHLQEYQGNTLNIPQKNIKQLIDNVYAKNKKVYSTNLELFKNSWESIEEEYFNLVADIFDKKYWPKGKYVAYLTIWGMFPRFLKDCTFCIPAYQPKNKKYVNAVIAHELLHFIFYDYFYKNYNHKKYSNTVWHVSEIFNVIVQNSKPWMKVFKIKPNPYPEHEKICKKFDNKYPVVNKENVDQLIERLMNETKKLR
jgi:predicted SprT family Zn-dependent metalloprotease